MGIYIALSGVVWRKNKRRVHRDCALEFRCARFQSEDSRAIFPGVPEVTSGDKVLAVQTVMSIRFSFQWRFRLIRRVSATVERRKVTLKKRTLTRERWKKSGESRIQGRDYRLQGPGWNVKFFEAKILEDLLYSAEPSLSSDRARRCTLTLHA